MKIEIVKSMRAKIIKWIGVLSVIGIITGCKNMSDIKAFTEARYTMRDLSEVRVNGINVSNKSSLDQFRMNEVATLLSAYNRNNLQADAMLGLHVELADGSSREITITQLKWQLLVDNKETLSGVMEEPLKLQAGLNLIPVRTPVMVTETNGNRNFEGLMQLVTLLSRDVKERPDIIFQIRPTVQTAVGNVEAPNFIPVYKPKG
jgi:hypothetical protein